MNHRRISDQTQATDSEQPAPAARSVIVEFGPAGKARILKAPADTLVVVAERKNITAAGRRSLGAGGRGTALAADSRPANGRAAPRQIAVSFPG